MKKPLSFVFCLLSSLAVASAAAADYPIRAAKMTDVKVTGGF